jgi:hypothetical protein
MLGFLHDRSEPSILTSVRTAIENGKSADLAVAYWGNGAIADLGIEPSKPARIICDLLSGGCNPNEIEKFFKPPFNKSQVQARHLSGLHAKVYWTPACVIVGSANASTKGLSEGNKSSNIEAALIADSREILLTVQNWFETQWGRAEPITPGLIQKGRLTWNKRPQIAIPGETFLQALVRSPSQFGNVTLLSYPDDPDEDAQAVFHEQAVAKNQYTDQELANYRAAYDRDYGAGASEGALGPFYQAGQPQKTFEAKPGDYVIDFNGDGGIPVFVSQIRRPGTIPISSDDCIVLMEPVTTDIHGFPFSKKERKALAKQIKAYKKIHRKKDDDVFFPMDQLPEELFALIKKMVQA